MAEKVRVGVIGCGAIAERLHVPDYAVCPEAEVVALCDILPDKAKALAQRFAPDARIYTDYEQMLKDGDVEAVSVCLPNYLHAPVTIAAVEAGCHVFCEKPLATSSEEAQRMIDAAKKAGVLLMGNQTQRRLPPHRKAKEVLASGVYGKLLYVTCMFGHSGPEIWSPPSKWFFKEEEAVFGATGDLGIHMADLVRYLSGQEIVEVSAFTAQLNKPGATVEDNYSSCIRLENGAIGTLSVSWDILGQPQNLTYFHCTNGTVKIDHSANCRVVGHMQDPFGTTYYDSPPALNDYPGTWGVDVGGAFARACLGKEEPFCTGEDAKRSLEVILAGVRSAQTGQTQKVNL